MPSVRTTPTNGDFILTLSDGEEERSAAAVEPSPDATDAENGPGKRRKRKLKKHSAAGDDGVVEPRAKKSKSGRHGSDRQRPHGHTEELNGSEKDAEAEAEAELGNDGAVDPDFVFAYDGGVDAGIVDVDSFDGWERTDKLRRAAAAGGVDSKKQQPRVDLDEIIERRRGQGETSGKRQARGGVSIVSVDNAEAAEDATEDEEGQVADEENSFEGFQSEDELLAADAFGMGAKLGAEHVDGDAHSEAMSEEQADDDADAEDNASNADSVASPMPHPDDERSDSESLADDEDDEAEAARRKAFFAPEEVPASSETTQQSKDKDRGGPASFQSMSLSRPVLKGLASVGFEKPTPIQAKTIPVALLGKDVVGGAVTGSGKTAAFLVPIFERLLYRPRGTPTSRVAILMPTRELAVQCYNVAKRLAAFTDITLCRLVGGFSLREQETELRRRPDVIIATPGRFIDHMRNSASFTVDTLEILVLDEADRMLEVGFADELNEILSTIPKSRQTMLFSATMTDSVDKLIRIGMTRPVRLMLGNRTQTVGTLIQEFVRLRPGREAKRLGYLLYLCVTVYTDRVIVFFRQKKETHRAKIIFGLLGLRAAELHGSMSQEQRLHSVDAFRNGRAAFLLATDLASRGLDIKGVETVINYEAPQSHEIYLHRVGRTARAGRAGRACTLAAEADRKVVRAIVKAGRSQSAKIVSRVVDAAAADAWAAKVDTLEDEVRAVLREEQEQKQLAQAEMQVTRGENLIAHQGEIMARPKRTWFESERDKKAAQQRGRAELNGATSGGGKPKGKEGKRKPSGKEKKAAEKKDQILSGKVWKKGKRDVADMSRTAATKAKGSGRKASGKAKARKANAGVK